MTSNELLYVKGARVWLPHPDTVWEGAALEKDYKRGDTLLILLKETGEKYDLQLKSENDLPPLRNPSVLIGQNDLTALSYLHEPAVLNNLEVRFRQKQAIYTYCGIVLVAINPYADLPLYGSDIIRAYRGHSMGELEPHIFAVAEEAYAKLEREKCNLSIIVSGESGAGKTVSAKYAMRYFAAVGGSESETQIERKVLASSPIMEAIGNAKTTRNDNSSRFGKFTKLLFKNDLGTMTLTGATMQTYLLEKSRVVFQAPGERNYHIFYQLCSARDQWPELILDHQNKFRYLNFGGSPDINKVSDLGQFSETVGALHTLGFSSQEIGDIMKVLAGILHLGNIKLNMKYKKNTEEIDHEGCDISPNDLHLNVMAEILRISSDDLRKWLIMRQIESVNEYVQIPNNAASAEAARDALAKHIYSKLFQYIVGVINKSLNCGKTQNCFIGVLDIYGFETFETNSFEQFCINYANEKLQQQFNQHVFTLEQEEYLKEGIVWTMIDFYDNQPCIDLIESKLGILDLLDEECRMPKGSDDSWAGKLYEKCIKYKHFERPRFGNSSFLVKHFSDTVQYDAFGFLEKNRDTVSKELVNVIRLSEMSLCKKLMDVDETDTLNEVKTSSGGRVVISASKSQGIPSKTHKQSVGSQFRDSLSLLITTLHATTPHYVRCIKPNEEKAAFKWEAPKIVQQLRACGVLETVRISAAGFPSRWSYLDFYNRYRLLSSMNQRIESDLKSTCKRIVIKWITDDDKYRFGLTQIFFRAGQVAYLEQVRTNIRIKYIVMVQSAVRRFVYRRCYIRLQKVALGIQRYARGLLARRKAKEIRENRAAITIQRYMRGWYARFRYHTIRRTICGMQQCARGLLARKKFKYMLDNYRATQIQRFCRGYLARQSFKKKLNSLVKCQSLVRAFLARRLYRRMKAEAKTISHMQKMYKGLENKIISLQQKIDELCKENTLLKIQNTEIPDLRRHMESKKSIENELKLLKLQQIEKDKSLMAMTKQLDVERDEKLAILDEKERESQEWNNQKQTWRLENEELKKQVDEMIEMAKKEETVTTNRTRLLSEIDNNEVHQAYQRALKDKEILEIENHSLKEELRRLQRSNGNIIEYSSHSRSLSNASSQNEEDYGYSSAKNTLDLKRNNQIDNNESASTEVFGKIDNTSTPKNSHTTLILRLRKVLEEEKNKNESLVKQLERWKSRKPLEDSLRASELEVENDRLRQDYESLRTSIKHGVHHQELEAQFMALQEELNRRRDECLQLRTVLAEQSQSIRTFGGGASNNKDFNTMPGGELAEAFQAQKIANRLLEAELKALTEENNARFAELTKQFEDMRNERNEFQTILQDSLQNCEEDNIEMLRRNEQYLRHELEKSYAEYVILQEQMNAVNNKLSELTRSNHALSIKLREYGGADSIVSTDDQKMLSVKKETAQTFQGFFKYSEDNIDKIFQRLITDLSPRVAIGLLPGLPAYIIFMCIRYTDLLNEDNRVKTLLTKFVLLMKKFYRLPNPTEVRVLWLVNSLTLHNLLKQYGGIAEFKNLNTECQNQQQLNHFDLSEYRQVIYEIIVNIYGALISQIQSSIKQLIVPAILEHDEMGTGAGKGRTFSLDSSPKQNKPVPELKGLLNQLELYRKQCHFFSLDNCYIEQIMKQLMHYICAVSMNNLMLSGKLCMWKTGMRIRYNTRCLKDWAREKKLANEVLTPLIPLTQASSLLQARKSEEDVDTLIDLCSNLTSAQVLKIIKSYNADDCEPRISNAFIEKLTTKLHEKHGNAAKDTFTMEENEVNHFSVVYKYSDIKLEEVELPKSLKLEGLLEKA